MLKEFFVDKQVDDFTNYLKQYSDTPFLVALEEGEDRAAIEHLTALVDHAPDFAEGYHRRATAYFRAGLLGPALDDLRQTLVLNPRHFRAMFGVGTIMEMFGRQDDAIAAYKAVLEIYPLEPDATDALARLAIEIEGQAI